MVWTIKKWYFRCAATNIEQTLSDLKKWSSWATYYASWNPDEDPPDAPSANCLGWNGTVMDFSFFQCPSLGFVKLERPSGGIPDGKVLRFYEQLSTLGRSLPDANANQRLEGVKTFLDHLISPKSVSPHVLSLHKAAARRASVRCSSDVPDVDTHISVKTSSCFENALGDGGQQKLVRTRMKGFLRKRVNIVFKRSSVQDGVVDVFGQAIFPFFKGSKLSIDSRWALIQNLKLGQVLFRLKPEVGPYSLGAPNQQSWFGGQGVDQYLGSCILLWAHRHCQQQGYAIIKSTDKTDFTVDSNDFVYSSIKRLLPMEQTVTPPIRVAVNGMPGLKARVVTVASVAVNIMLQAVKWLWWPSVNRHPYLAVVAEFGADKLYWASRKVGWKLTQARMGTGQTFAESADLQAASESFARDLCRSWLRGWAAGQRWQRYHPVRLYEDLIVGPRDLCETAPLIQEDGILFSIKEYLNGRLHTNGILLGDATTSTLLQISSICLTDLTRDCYTAGRQIRDLSHIDLRNTWRPSYHLVDGDDRFNIVERDWRPYSKGVVSASELYLSPGKDTFSQYTGVFTEDRVIKGEVFWEYRDMIKIRYFSRATPDFKERRDIAFSKANAISRRVGYLLESKREQDHRLADAVSHLYWYVHRKLDDYPGLPFCFPLNLGGAGSPDEFGWEDMVMSVSPKILGVIWYVLHPKQDDQKHQKVSWSLSQLATRRSKGLENPLSSGKILTTALRSANSAIILDYGLDKDVLVGSSLLLDWMERQDIAMPTYWNGGINYRALVEKIEQLFNLVPLSQLAKDCDRCESFANAFVGQATTKAHVIDLRTYSKNWSVLTRQTDVTSIEPGTFLGKFPSRKALDDYAKSIVPNLFINRKSKIYSEILDGGPSLTAKWTVP